MKETYTHGTAGKRPLFAAFDLETEGLGGRVLAASFMREGDAKPSYICKGNIISRLFNIMAANSDYQWFAHNAQYEFRYLLDHMRRFRNNITLFNRTDTDFYRIDFEFEDDEGKPYKLTLRDSFAVFPKKLADFSAKFCPEFPKLEFDFENVPFDPLNPDHREYSMRDSQTLLLSLMRFDNLVFNTFGVHIRATTASTALAAWQTTIPKGTHYKPNKAVDNISRSAYYGGLVFLTSTNVHRNARSYDINSSYPYQMMTHGVPYGDATETTFFHSDKLGIYDVTIKAPDDLIVPIIPHRDDKGILWNRGTFRTTVTSPEIEFALSHGYRLLTVHGGVVWSETVYPFSDFISKCMSIRFEHKGTALEEVAKLMQNSLYGKFGSKKERRKFYGAEPTAENKQPWGDFWTATETDDEMLAMPQWAAFITARARLHLLSTIYEIGPDNVLYGDTDSITVKEGIYLPEGKEYGAWKCDKRYIAFRARAPKIYAGILESEEAGFKMTGAAKGIPRNQWHKAGIFPAILSEKQNVISYISLDSFAVVLKTGYIGTHERSRSLSELFKSRSWQIEAGGNVRPKYATDNGQRDRFTVRNRNQSEPDQIVFRSING